MNSIIWYTKLKVVDKAFVNFLFRNLLLVQFYYTQFLAKSKPLSAHFYNLTLNVRYLFFHGGLEENLNSYKNTYSNLYLLEGFGLTFMIEIET